MTRRFGHSIEKLIFIFSLYCGLGHAVTWMPFGPDGGDARSIAADPSNSKHLYLGAANGWIFESLDGGSIWKRLARVGKRDDLVLDNILVDASNPKHLIVGAWVLGSVDGGLFASNDAGLTWAGISGMAGQSVRSLAASVTDPKTLIVGTLNGVYRSTDAGLGWKLISPEGSREIHEVESIAIDPSDPRIIYAGTWHLPWKTVDGGEHWSSIKEGIIEDSDVFSIIVDPKQPSVVYASACSGIYRSENAGSRFKKIQGIPSTARRTRVLMQDPNHLNTVYAGTTEGLFRTDDSGTTWVRTTGSELIVNDVYVDPSDSTHVLLATDRGGVLSSHDRGNSFDATNAGFSARQVTSYVADVQRPSNVFVGIVNDKEWGGVFASENGGLSWIQESSGLGGRDVFSLGQASDGTIIAGTGHGIYRLNGAMWSRAGSAAPSSAAKAAGKRMPIARPGKSGKPASSRPSASRAEPALAGTVGDFDGSVYAIAQAGDTLYAATSDGLLASATAGQSWGRVLGAERQELLFVSVAKRVIVTAGLRSAMFSVDGGKDWKSLKLPEMLTQISAVAADGTGAVWVGGREGLFATNDGGASWETLKNMYIRDVNSMYYDGASERITVTAGGVSTMAFAVHLPERSVRFWDTGWNLRFARPVGDHLIAATLFDGMVVQPQMVDSAEVGKR
ncbi:MAG: BNR/Asp-box repeat domain/two component regulator propeller [Acidobacteriaceae bacterium]|nr:BNR/Asp-box repeat domain/two component regulator propeller [Acidobacteriaceae bacterium]